MKDKLAKWVNTIHVGDCRALMRQMVRDGIQAQMVVTSPPYWNLRQYGHKQQHGLESSPRQHILRMRSVFRLVRDVLKTNGTLWLNYGDSYASGGGSGKQGNSDGRVGRRVPDRPQNYSRIKAQHGFKPKDLYGMGWRIAFALQDDGWWLRSPIIWHKSNPMPESSKDRPTTAHEYLFLLARSKRYYYDPMGVREALSPDTHARLAKGQTKSVTGWDMGPGSHSTLEHAAEKPMTEREHEKQMQHLRDVTKFGSKDSPEKVHVFVSNGVGFGHGYDDPPKDRAHRVKSINAAGEMDQDEYGTDRGLRTVWKFPTEAFPGAHFATFPRALVERCILLGSKPGDIIFDPYAGTGTVAEVAAELGRRYIGCEINARYVAMFKRYRSQQLGLHL